MKLRIILGEVCHDTSVISMVFTAVLIIMSAFNLMISPGTRPMELQTGLILALVSLVFSLLTRGTYRLLSNR